MLKMRNKHLTCRFKFVQYRYKYIVDLQSDTTDTNAVHVVSNVQFLSHLFTK